MFDYFSMRHQLAANNYVADSLTQRSEEVLHQREQIQKFAVELNALKDKLVQLNNFKEKIRIIANIDRPYGYDSFFGVGGEAPDDLIPSIELTERHQQLIKDMHQQIDLLDSTSNQQRNDFESLLNKLAAQKNLLAHMPAIRPASGWVTSQFGYRQSPFTGKREFHKGLDIANRVGTPIVATANGIVSYSGKKGMLGNVVIIDHGHGLITRYGHLDSLEIKVGALVKRGQVIARMGNSGKCADPHLHYEVRLNGVPINPTKYILN
jgi:murein DD-endopeptidase MepM/ murein hydrolase activator NlpD